VDVVSRTDHALRSDAAAASESPLDCSRDRIDASRGTRPPRLITAIVAALLALPASAAVAQDRDSTVSWEALGKVTGVTLQGRYVPEFPKDLEALDGKVVRLDGFMMPLDEGAQQQTRFLFMPEPWDGDCIPVGAEQIVEVRARSTFKYVLDRITLQGRFVLVRDDAGTLLYRLTDAIPTER
jgi:hypothetical protein